MTYAIEMIFDDEYAKAVLEGKIQVAEAILDLLDDENKRIVKVISSV